MRKVVLDPDSFDIRHSISRGNCEGRTGPRIQDPRNIDLIWAAAPEPLWMLCSTFGTCGYLGGRQHVA